MVAARISADGVCRRDGNAVVPQVSVADKTKRREGVRSYWAASAPAFAPAPALKQDIETDVAIVGAGFTGLSAAYHLAQAGQRCVILDANEPGWGASGRNGGIAVPRYKPTYSELATKYGIETAVALHQLAHAAVDTLEDVIATNGIACSFARDGHITPVVRDADIERFAMDVRWLEREAGDRATSMLGGQEIRRRTGTAFYRDGYFEPRGGSIHPLAYCRGLASVLTAKGVGIYCRTKVLRTREAANEIVLDCAGGRVKTRALVMATNGYTDLSEAGDALRRRVVPVVSSLIATEPLPKHILGGILPQRNPVTDAKRLTNYFRLVGESRLLFGGRGGATNRESPRIYRRLMRDMLMIFPQLQGVRCDYAWSGRVAVTLDSLPHLGRIGRNTFYAMGYNGRGVALGCYLGKMLARAVAGDLAELGPITSGPFGRIPFHSLRTPAKRAVIAYYGILDRLK